MSVKINTRVINQKGSLVASLGVVGRAVPLLGGEKSRRDDAPYAVGEVNRRRIHLEMFHQGEGIHHLLEFSCIVTERRAP